MAAASCTILLNGEVIRVFGGNRADVREMALLACYDCFQWNQNVKPDYCNAGGLEMWDEEEQDWVTWYYEDEHNYYEDVEEYCKECLRDWDTSVAFQSELYKQVHF